MLFKQYFFGSPAQASYLIGDELTKHAVVIDPQGDVERYLTDVRRAGYSIRYVVVTTFGDDATFAGPAALRARTGARIMTSARVDVANNSPGMFDGVRLDVGNLRLEFHEGSDAAEDGAAVSVYDLEKSTATPCIVLGSDTLSIDPPAAGEPADADARPRSFSRKAEASVAAAETRQELPVVAIRPGLVRAFPQITAGALADRWTETSAPTVVDVRSEREWNIGHLIGSRNIPLSQLSRRFSEIPRDRPVIVYCANGQRSILAASRLAAAGYTNVAELTGGYQSWIMALLPVESELTLVAEETAEASEVLHGETCAA